MCRTCVKTFRMEHISKYHILIYVLRYMYALTFTGTIFILIEIKTAFPFVPTVARERKKWIDEL